ncbi:hypothetical protein EAF04_004202 [Stromatinia cepivora]|nr:hypothetical protein EAF04_004202 [Stromatinia cepivora]
MASFLISLVSIATSPWIVFVSKLPTIRDSCMALFTCNLVTSILLITGTVFMAQIPSQVSVAIVASALSDKISVVRGTGILALSCLTTIISCFTLCIFLALS